MAKPKMIGIQCMKRLIPSVIVTSLLLPFVQRLRQHLHHHHHQEAEVSSKPEKRSATRALRDSR